MKKSLSQIKKVAEHFPGYDHLVLPWHKYQAFRAATKSDYPASGLKVIGVTGTNGKTTTCFMIHRMLTEAGFKVGLMTTVAYGVGKNIKPQLEHMTTVDAKLLNKRIKDIADADAEFLVLELTSHALSQYRAFGIPIDVAVETNVTHEHLDYHKTFKKYRAAKLKLFKNANSNRDGHKVGIINADDPSARYFAAEIERPITYGIEKGEIRARQLKISPDGVDYFVKYDGRKLHIKTQIPGLFNVYNSLAAATVGIIYGLSNKQIEAGIFALDYVEGRMNRIKAGQDFDIYVDFAHTPDAMEKVFQSVKDRKGEIITLFGLPGDRDASNRPLMGRLAGKYSDQIIVTSDDSRDEDPAEIAKQIVGGIKRTGNKNYQVIIDREAAIREALSMATEGDVVLLLGKGHEKTLIGRERETLERGWHRAQDFEIIVDYAHTPDSFEQLLPEMKKAAKGKMIVLFGSAGGRRDPSKRRPMGEIAGKYADIVVLTEEDDRDTPGDKILNQIAGGAKKSGKIEDKNLFLIPDRTEAIEFALGKAKRGDLVLLLGKGNEKTIERADGEHPWDESATARRILKKLT